MKKKGLLISTIVMVVVLIASLTTATYAWFSAQASVSVSDITMTTEAATGLEIGVVTTTASSGYASGTVTFGTTTAGKWDGDTDGMSSEVAIDASVEFAGLENAVTRVTSTATRYPFKVVTAGASSVGASKTYASAEAVSELDAAGIAALEVDDVVYCTYAVDTLLVPTGYDPESDSANPTPIGYKVAAANVDYIDLPLAVQAISTGIKQIYYTVTVTSVMGDVPAGLAPGMAAGLRLQLVVDGVEVESAIDSFDADYLKPFNEYALAVGATAFTSTGTAEDGAVATVGGALTWTFSGFLYNDSTEITTYVPHTISVIAYIEGEDNACVTKTAGSGFTINIAFDFQEAQSKAITDGVLGNA